MKNESDDGFAIHVAVVDDAIIVTMAGTRYSITYRNKDEPWLLASDRYDDPDFPCRKFTFQAALSLAAVQARRY
jgi:hypothetical protein